MNLWLQVLSIEWRKLLSYRADFWLRFLGATAAQVTVSYALWSAVFAHTGQNAIGGYNFSALILYYLLTQLVSNTTTAQEGGQVAEDIYSGGLTKFILYPANFFGFKYTAGLASALLALLQLLIVLALYLTIYGMPSEVQMTPASVGVGCVLALAAGALNFLMVAALGQVAFWADRVWSLDVMLSFSTRLLGGAMLPLTLFPQWFQHAIMYLPFPYLIAMPTRAMMGELDLTTGTQALATTLIWCLLFAAINRLLWWRGCLRYTGVGL